MPKVVTERMVTVSGCVAAAVRDALREVAHERRARVSEVLREIIMAWYARAREEVEHANDRDG